MDWGTFLIVWSIRCSLVLLVATLMAWLLKRAESRPGLAVRVMWTLSFLFFVLHVAASFHFVHHWSHREAYLATAKETGELMGVEFGEGVYFNYLFLAAWASHLWFTWFPAPANNLFVRTAQQIFLLYMSFIAFNGVVVFKSGWLRTIGIVATVALVAIAVGKVIHSQRRPAQAR